MKNGDYILIIPPDNYPGKKYRGRYAYEHRVNWWKQTGKNPDDFPGLQIHHKNEDKFDNSEKNLQSIDLVDHAKLHAKRAPHRKFICENCGKTFFVRLRPSNHQRFCSRQCIGSFGFNMKDGRYAEKWLRIKEYVERGVSDYTIAAITGIPRATVQRVRNKNHLPRQPVYKGK